MLRNHFNLSVIFKHAFALEVVDLNAFLYIEKLQLQYSENALYSVLLGLRTP